MSNQGSVARRLRVGGAAIVLAVFALTSFGQPNTHVAHATIDVNGTWSASWVGPANYGDCMLDVAQSGTDLSADVDCGPWGAATLSGTIDTGTGEFLLSLGPSAGICSVEVSITGTFDAEATTFTGEFTCTNDVFTYEFAIVGNSDCSGSPPCGALTTSPLWTLNKPLLTSHATTATVTLDGSPASSVDVSFTVEGAHPSGPEIRTTDGSGLTPAFNYSGTAVGGDYVYATTTVGGRNRVDVSFVSWVFPTMIGHWQFNEGNGTVASDGSGVGHHGSLMGGPVWEGGYAATSLKFDGIDDLVQVPDSALLDIGTSDFTLAGWIRRGSGSGHATIFSKSLFDGSPGYYLGIAPSGKLHIEITKAPGGVTLSAQSAGLVPTDSWHHVAVTLTRAGSATFYIDGAASGAVDISGFQGDLSNSSPLQFARSEFDPRPYTGKLDELRMYYYSLSSTEVSALAAEAPSCNSGNPLHDCDIDNVNNAPDNCPFVANPGQENNDRNFIDLSPPKAYDDASRPMSDSIGDVCDSDDDNDGRSDTDELSGTGCGPHVSPTNPAVDDSDGDRVVDGTECFLGTDPADAGSAPAIAFCQAAGDSDLDGVFDSRELCYFGTSIASTNSDGDTLDDSCEIASINADLVVNVIDLQQIAQHTPSGGQGYLLNMDVNRDGVVNVLDLSYVAARSIPCP